MSLNLSTANLNWTAISGATGYQIVLDGATVSTAGPRATTTKIFLSAGINHEVDIVAIPNGETQSINLQWNPIVTPPPPPPATPLELPLIL